jgi:diaminobutyrate-2-oxoglutarate transaminase
MESAQELNTYLEPEIESNVRSYSRHFPCVFTHAKGSVLRSSAGRRYLDFFSGAGALNYGHNNEYIKARVLEYLAEDGILHGLDMQTAAKQEFLHEFTERVLRPEGHHYKVQFCGPTGTNAVEAALKLARKVTGRGGVFSLMGSFHGMSAGSLSVSGAKFGKVGTRGHAENVTFFPLASERFASLSTVEYMKAVLEDDHSGILMPAAIIIESVQAEGGVVVLGSDMLRGLSRLCADHGILLICDDIQVGCGRTGPFFSFERAGIRPDIVLLSKSLSGYGFPMAVLLMKPELDVWMPGEHTGTFRGFQLAYVGAKAALELRDGLELDLMVVHRGKLMQDYLISEVGPAPIQVRGLGMIWGLDFSDSQCGTTAEQVASLCFENGLIVETAGRGNSVLKLMPALTISEDELLNGLEILKCSIRQARGW